MPTTAPIARADFADWLSPMLVKELRQGVRTRVFVILFILLQVCMLLDLVLSLLIASTGASTSEGTYFFWFMVSVPTLLIIPISGLGAIGNEIRGNTLELIFLTRLTRLPHRRRQMVRAPRAQVAAARVRRAAVPGAALFHRRRGSRQRTIDRSARCSDTRRRF